MSDHGELERRYRRLLAFYPRAFRREHEEELLVVLLACAPDGRRRPGLADSVNLIANALWLRVRPGASRSVPTVRWAVRLMLLAGALELAACATVVVSQDSVRTALLRHVPRFSAGQWNGVVHAHILPVEVGAPIAALVWMVAAWANSRGYRWSRLLVGALLALTSLSLCSALAGHAASYAPADLLAGVGVWLAALVSTLLIISTDSACHYNAGGGQRDRHAIGDRRSSTAGPWGANGGTASWN